ncbi:MAG: hypothetical protein WA821_02375, partial [Anaerolineales bacterium]
WERNAIIRAMLCWPTELRQLYTDKQTMFKQITRWLDPILLIGLTISITISVVMVLTGNDSLPSLSVGLLSTIITLLIDVIAKIQKAENAFLDAAGFSRILTDKFIGSSLQEIADRYEKVKSWNFSHYNSIAETAIDECRAMLREIASGSVIVKAKTIQGYGVKSIEQARHDVKAIHIGSMEFWNSDFGIRYFELNRAAVKRGVKITRIFALAPDEIKNFIEKLKEQERAGIRVLIVKPGRVDHEFVITDEQVLIDFEVDTTRDYRLERIIIEPTQVKRRREEFQELVTRYAKTLKDVLSTL